MISFFHTPEYPVWDIRSSRCTVVSLTLVANGKSSIRKVLNNCLDTFGELIYKDIFFLQVHFKVYAVWFCSYYLPPVSMTLAVLVANLPPVLLIPLANLPPVVLTPATNLLLVLLTPGQICHRCRWHQWCTLTCEYLCKFLQKTVNDPNVIFLGLGEDDSWKKPEAKISWHCPFKIKVYF